MGGTSSRQGEEAIRGERTDATQSGVTLHERLRAFYYQLDAKINYATGMLVEHPSRLNAWKIIDEINTIRFEIDKVFSEMEGEGDDE